MKLGYSLGIFATLLFVFPSISEARQGEPPRSCMRNGYVDCSIHGCQRYCNNGNNRHNGHRVNPAPPPVVRPAPQPPVVRPVPQPAERVVVTRPIAPAPAPIVVVEHRRSKQEIKREIKRLERENDRLEDQLEEEERRTNTIYVDVLFRSTLPIVAFMTIRAFERLKKISERINARFGT